MPISNAAIPYLNVIRSEIVFIELLTINNTNMATLFVANYHEDITSRGITFLASAFEIILPNQDPESLPDITIKICNVSPAIMEFVRAMETPPSLRLEIVTNLNLDLVEITVDYLKMRNVTYNAFEITGTLLVDNWLARKFGDLYDPVQFPGLFAI